MKWQIKIQTLKTLTRILDPVFFQTEKVNMLNIYCELFLWGIKTLKYSHSVFYVFKWFLVILIYFCMLIHHFNSIYLSFYMSTYMSLFIYKLSLSCFWNTRTINSSECRIQHFSPLIHLSIYYLPMYI